MESKISHKREKAEQRRRYHEVFAKVKHGHGGGRSIKKKEEAALGK